MIKAVKKAAMKTTMAKPDAPKGWRKVSKGKIKTGDKFWLDRNKEWVTTISEGCVIDGQLIYIRRVREVKRGGKSK